MSAVLAALCSNAVLAGLLGALLLLLGRFVCRPALLHAFWLVVLFKLLCPPLLTIPVDIGLLMRSKTTWTGSEIEHVPALGLPALQAGVAAPASGVIPRVMAAAAIRWREALLILWCCGSLVCVVAAARQSWQLRKLLFLTKTGSVKRLSPTGPEIQELGIRRPVEIRTVPESFPPFLWPWGRTVQVVLPSRLLSSLDTQGVWQLVIHELAHYRRRDHVTGLLQLICQILFWWHPVVWIANRKLHEYGEMCCDAWVVRLTASESPGAYARTLLATLDFICDRRLPLEAPAMMGGHARLLRRRLEMIMIGHSATQTSTTGLALALLFALATLPLAGSGRQEQEPAKPTEQSEARPEPTPEDVAETVRKALQEVDTDKVIREAMAEVDKALKTIEGEHKVLQALHELDVQKILQDALSDLDEAKLELEIRQELDTLDVAETVARTLAEVRETLSSARLQETIQQSLEAQKLSQEEVQRILEDVRKSIDPEAIERSIREALQGIDVDKIVEEAVQEAEKAKQQPRENPQEPKP